MQTLIFARYALHASLSGELVDDDEWLDESYKRTEALDASVDLITSGIYESFSFENDEMVFNDGDIFYVALDPLACHAAFTSSSFKGTSDWLIFRPGAPCFSAKKERDLSPFSAADNVMVIYFQTIGDTDASQIARNIERDLGKDKCGVAFEFDDGAALFVARNEPPLTLFRRIAHRLKTTARWKIVNGDQVEQSEASAT
jgi:hypothetical protein